MDLSKAFDDLTWDNVVIEDGVLKSIREFPINELKHKDLRAVCSRLKLKGVKNTTKESMIEKIVSVYKLKDRYSRLNEDVDPFLTPTRKEPQCPYRLLNILFSDVFCEGLSQLGNAADRFELDTGKASNNQLFWEGVQEAFTSPSELIDNLHFDDEVFKDLHHINFKRIIHHDWRKLRVMWKNLNGEYKAALGRYTMSGNHASNFFDFCHGRRDIYYLRKHLESKPNLNATVAADLPEEVSISSTGRPASRLSSTSFLSTSTATATTTKRKGEKGEVIDLIRDMQADRDNKKTKDAHWREQEHIRLEKEEERRDRDDARKEEEHLYGQWERARLNIQQLSAALSMETNEMLRQDIQSDIFALLNRKKMLAEKLNLN